MELSEIYPRFTITDEWGRELEFGATANCYTRRVVNVGVPGLPLAAETSVSRLVYALGLLDAIEQAAGDGSRARKPHKTRRSDPSDTPDLDAFFGGR